MLHVEGRNEKSVRYAVSSQGGYSGRKAEISDDVTMYTLDFLQGRLPVGSIGEYTDQFFQSHEAVTKSHVRGEMMKQRPSFWSSPVQFITWPAVISAIISYVVPLILRWLLSEDSKNWREAQG